LLLTFSISSLLAVDRAGRPTVAEAAEALEATDAMFPAKVAAVDQVPKCPSRLPSQLNTRLLWARAVPQELGQHPMSAATLGATHCLHLSPQQAAVVVVRRQPVKTRAAQVAVAAALAQGSQERHQAVLGLQDRATLVDLPQRIMPLTDHSAVVVVLGQLVPTGVRARAQALTAAQEWLVL
jgi:hypothetical protein